MLLRFLDLDVIRGFGRVMISPEEGEDWGAECDIPMLRSPCGGSIALARREARCRLRDFDNCSRVDRDLGVLEKVVGKP